MSVLVLGKSKKSSCLLSDLILSMFFPFFIWSFLGGHKQYLLGFSSDHVVTLLALMAAFVVFLTKKTYTIKEVFIFVFIGLMFFLLSVSVFQSAKPLESVVQVLTQGVYLLITFGCAVFFKSRVDIFFRLIIFSTCFCAVIILISYLFLGLGSWGRVTIPIYEGGIFSYFPNGYESSSDPNVLSYFVYIGALVIIYIKGFVGWWRPVLLVLLLSGFITMSRSGLLAFLVAVAFYMMINAFFNIFKGKTGVSASSVASTVFFVTAIICFLFFVVDLESAYTLVLDRISDDGSNFDRIRRILLSVDILFDDAFLFFFGRGMGYSRYSVDPHLFYISTILDTGFFSLVVILAALFIPVISIMRKSSECKEIAFVGALAIFFLTISLFYWQVRTYYFVLLILFVICFSQSARKYSGTKNIDYRIV